LSVVETDLDSALGRITHLRHWASLLESHDRRLKPKPMPLLGAIWGIVKALGPKWERVLVNIPNELTLLTDEEYLESLLYHLLAFCVLPPEGNVQVNAKPNSEGISLSACLKKQFSLARCHA